MIRAMPHNDISEIQKKRHTLAHLLAAAVLELFPDAKPTIGPAVDNGFYYDIEFSTPIAETDLKDIEKKMRKLASFLEGDDRQRSLCR